MVHATTSPVFPNQLSPYAPLAQPDAWGIPERRAFQYTLTWILYHLPHHPARLEHTPLASTLSTLPHTVWTLHRFAREQATPTQAPLWNTHLILPTLAALWGEEPMTLNHFLSPSLIVWPDYARLWLALHHPDGENFVCAYLEHFSDLFRPAPLLWTRRWKVHQSSPASPPLVSPDSWTPPANLVFSPAFQRDYQRASKTIRDTTQRQLTKLAQIPQGHYKRIQRADKLYELRIAYGWRLIFSRKHGMYYVDRLCPHNVIMRKT